METPAIASPEHVDIQERVVGDVRWIAIQSVVTPLRPERLRRQLQGSHCM
jgi:hypothetical protein